MSTLLEQASLVMIPSGYKEDIVYSQIPTNGNGDLSFTRASNGTRVNSAGLVEVCPWNLLQYSEQFNVSPWQSYNQGTGVLPVITANDTTAPNGTTTADKVVFDTGPGTSASDISTIYQTLSSQAEGVYTASIYAKVASGTAKILLRHAGGGTYTTLNLTTEWQRFEVAETLVGSTSFSFEIGLRRGLSNEPLTSPVTCYLWGAQINVGTAKPYFPTTDRLNVPRLTYQNGGGGCPSLLLEKQSTNIVTYSEDFSNADWLKQQSTISANATTSPDGTQNADKLIINNGVAGGYVYQLKSTSSGTVYTGSFYVKAGGVGYTKFWTNISGSYEDAVINLSTGAITNSNFAITPTAQSVGNGWYRVVYTTTSGGGQVVVYVDGGSTSTGGSYTGNGTDGIFLWGAQVEASTYVTSYIPTTSSSATRVADACYKTGIGSLFGTNKGTFFWQGVTPYYVSGAAQYLWDISDTINFNLNRFALYMVGTNLVQLYTSVTGGNNATLAQNSFAKIALVWDGTSCSLYINGAVAILNQTISNSNPTAIHLNTRYSVNENGNTEVGEVVVFNTNLTNAELIALTTL